VLGLEVEGTLAVSARENLSSMPWVEVRCDDGTAPVAEPFEAVLINAGVTHPEAAWLDALTPGGRLIMPITAALPVPVPGTGTSFGLTIGKGPMVIVTRRAR
jgi:protein-L-isoaspartate(D-aspartate) O-methyltransferase